MSQVPRRVGCTINGQAVTSASYSCDLNGQASWSATVPGRTSLSPAASSTTLIAGGWQSPPLIGITSESQTSPPTTTFSGCDLWTYKLSATGISMPTFKGMPASFILAAIGARVGVSISGGPGAIIPEFEVQATSPLLEYVTRIARDYGMVYAVRANGIELLTPSPADSIPGFSEAVRITERLSLGELTTGVRVKGKRKQDGRFEFQADKAGTFNGSMGDGVAVPGLTLQVENTVGHVVYAVAYDKKGAVCGKWIFDTTYAPPLPPIGSSDPATEMYFGVAPPASDPSATGIACKLIVMSASGPYGPPFECSLDGSNPTGREKLLLVESTLYPDSASVPLQAMLDVANMGVHTYEAELAFNPSIELSSSISSVSWSVGQGAPTTSVRGFLKI